METTSPRCLRPSQRDEPSFALRANPSPSPDRDGARSAHRRLADSGYPEKCNPNRARSPLDEDQKGLAGRYLPLARSMARRFARTLPRACDDLESAACMALVEAAQSFDPARNVDFAVYARHRIQGALRDTRQEALRPDGRPTDGSLPDCARVAWDEGECAWIFGAPPAPAVGADFEDLELARALIEKLPRLQCQAFRHIYLEGKSQEEAAAILGCSPPTMSRLHREAIESIRYLRYPA